MQSALKVINAALDVWEDVITGKRSVMPSNNGVNQFRAAHNTYTYGNYNILIHVRTHNVTLGIMKNVLTLTIENEKINLDTFTKEEHFQLSTIIDLTDYPYHSLMKVHERYYSVQERIVPVLKETQEQWNSAMDKFSRNIRDSFNNLSYSIRENINDFSIPIVIDINKDR